MKYKYLLHDAIINDIFCNDDGIDLFFEKGVYIVNEQGKEAELSGPCKMRITLPFFDSNKMFQFITVTKIKKSTISDIEFADFLKILRKYTFRIYIDYYSFFGASVLFIGDCGENVIHLTITDIDKVEYIFEQ